VTAQRPTVASDTATTPAGHAELEVGVHVDPGELLDVPAQAKLGLDAQTELFLESSWRRLTGEDVDGRGEVIVGARRRFREEGPERASLAAQLWYESRAGDADLGRRSGALLVALMATRQIGDASGTLYGQTGAADDPDGSGWDLELEHALAGLVAFPLAPRTSAFCELAYQWVPELDDEQALLTIGTTFRVGAASVLDAGAVVGLTDDVPDLQLVFGLTLPLGHLWLADDGRHP